MKDKKKHDILNSVKNFPEVKTSDSFMDDLHLKLDKVIAEENNPSGSKAEESTSGNKKSFSDHISDFFSKRYLIPAFGIILIIFLFVYFFKGRDTVKINAENGITNNKGTSEEEITKGTDKSKEKESKNPFDIDPVTKGKIDSITSPIIENPQRELSKFVARGKNAVEENRKYFSALIREKENELKLFRPEEVIKNFGSFAFTLDPKEFRTIDLRSRSYDLKSLEIIKEKIDSISR
ncbi:MAG: hypothetical protein JSS91_07530 [Bacteroidetes bacterium]|nr:hypothetical protein [Bacteroidota bacterium]